MFGYIVANTDKLTPQQKELYKACYCGLCKTIGKRHGNFSRLTLTYDMAFLILILSDVYDIPLEPEDGRCIIHPTKALAYAANDITAYAADMNVALAYYKCLDDWNDEKNIVKLSEAKLMAQANKRISQQYPRQCLNIASCIYELANIEKAGITNPDIPAKCFGRLMGELFVWKEDEYAQILRTLGDRLGRFIYMMDAVMDLREDIQKERYNPLVSLTDVDYKILLSVIMAECVDAYHKLPITKNGEMLENILYCGVWSKFEAAQEEKGKKNK
ncbi:MAG: DUF5685 family protein [Oscillospiraceae bacterium]|nr:DUF5685 family protein [Oscillospiraceae bacterium]